MWTRGGSVDCFSVLTLCSVLSVSCVNTRSSSSSSVCACVCNAIQRVDEVLVRGPVAAWLRLCGLRMHVPVAEEREKKAIGLLGSGSLPLGGFHACATWTAECGDLMSRVASSVDGCDGYLTTVLEG